MIVFDHDPAGLLAFFAAGDLAAAARLPGTTALVL
jgi:hypothetical protein